MSLHAHSVLQMSSMLRNLEGFLAKAVAFAEAKPMEVDALLNARLSPDMRPLTFQIQAACDAAKFAGARLAGVEAPSHPDTEETLAQLRSRIAAVLEYLAGLDAEAVNAGADRDVRLGFLPGKVLRGEDYLRQLALPNFYFHVTTAYALLRATGVAIGKQDFITELNMRDDEAAQS